MWLILEDVDVFNLNDKLQTFMRSWAQKTVKLFNLCSADKPLSNNLVIMILLGKLHALFKLKN